MSNQIITKDAIIKLIWAATVVLGGALVNIVWGKVEAAETKAIANEQAIAVVDTKMDVLLESLGLGERAREALETRLTPDSEGTSSGEGQDSDDD